MSAFGSLRLHRFLVAAALLLAAMGACSGPQIYSTSQHQAVSLKKGELQQGGVAFITPSTVTGQEEDKQALALAVASVMSEQLSGVRCVPLAETLGMVNRAGLAADYKKMYDEYRDTGIFTRETLKEYLEQHFHNLDFSDFECERVTNKPPRSGPVNPDYYQHGILKAVEQELLELGASNGNRTSASQGGRGIAPQRLPLGLSRLHHQRKPGDGRHHPVRRERLR